MNSNIILRDSEQTVAAEFVPSIKTRTTYQSEEELENELIDNLKSQGYEFLDIHTSQELIDNLRIQLEKLNHFKFTNSEWDWFFHNCIAKSGDGIQEKTEKIQTDYIQTLNKEDGTKFNVYLINKKNIHENNLQVIHQYSISGNYDNRYDVTILVNGLPLVHCELKRRGVALREAFNQIERYQKDSFWADSGLFEYIQIFVISNGTETKYYSNTTRFNAVEEKNNKRRAKRTNQSSFEFTSYWADAKNQNILDLVDFTKTFFTKTALCNILTKYCVFTVDKNLMVMRPYQIAATEAILRTLNIDHNTNRWGSIDAGNYIWHTTGSGKTLTSFKTSQLIVDMAFAEKVIFVVDRQDLDYQTMKEYNKFEEGAANGNKDTATLKKQLEDPLCHIIVTTVQKLSIFCKKNPTHSIYNKNVVLIFDECHRSQFGDMHAVIAKRFKKYAMFGFTGTPIFAVNSNPGNGPLQRTTEQLFGTKAHTYTVVNAINDKNVLPFKVDYINTIREVVGTDELVEGIDDEKILLAEDRVSLVCKYILDHFNQKTMRNYSYDYHGKKMNGFNSLFAVSSIAAAKVYYTELKKQIAAKKGCNLKIATIYSFTPNDDILGNYTLDEDSDSTESLNVDDRDFLEHAIKDYNTIFGTQFDTGATFANYYKDVSQRMKDNEIDILIVVNMFLTGFDAPTLNTLWVDKNLKQHGLIQAFSRTNRILNSIKAYGNIVCFRNLRKEVDDAIALFGDDEAKGIILLKSFDEYYNGYDEEQNNGKTKHIDGYKDLIDKLKKDYPIGKPPRTDKEKKRLVVLMGKILRQQNILRSFDDFQGKEILSDFELQDYLSIYNDLHDELKVVKDKGEDVSSDIVFEMELVKQIVVNIDYILDLIQKHHMENTMNREIPVDVRRAITSNPELRSKMDLIEIFIQKTNLSEDIHSDWSEFVKQEREKALTEMIKTEKLHNEETRNLIDKLFRSGQFEISDAELSKIMPPVSRFGKSNRIELKEKLKAKLKDFFDKYNLTE